MINHKKLYKVMASVYPIPHNKIWLSSGRVPLYNNYEENRYLKLSFNGSICKFGGRDES